MLKAISFSFCCNILGFCYSQETNTTYFKNINQSYNNYLICNDKIDNVGGNFPIKIQGISSSNDTLVYKIDFFELYGSSTRGLTKHLMGEEYLLLKIVNNCLFVDYDPNVKAANPYMRLKMAKLLDLKAPLNECNEINNYFDSDRVRVCIFKKSYSHYLKDTVYNCRINRSKVEMTDVALPISFHFTKKHGFIIWELGILNKNCQSYFLDSRFRRKKLLMIINK